jgi:hypothetical protein
MSPGTKNCTKKLFTLNGDVVGNKMPQSIQVPLHVLDLLPYFVKVAKLAAQLTELSNDDVYTLGPIANGTDDVTFDEVRTCFSMYVPGKYFPLLIARHMTPSKEALLPINAKAVLQNEQDMLAPLIKWLRVP